jgi:hypothetical protein
MLSYFAGSMYDFALAVFASTGPPRPRCHWNILAKNNSLYVYLGTRRLEMVWPDCLDCITTLVTDKFPVYAQCKIADTLYGIIAAQTRNFSQR